MSIVERLFRHRFHRVILSLVAALMLVGAGLFVADRMSRTVFSGTGPVPQGTLPDLAISSEDIGFSNGAPYDGDVIEMCATVHNIGNASAIEVVTAFFDHFGNSSEKIGSTLIREIPAGAKETMCISWTATPAGTHGIVVSVDPENFILE